MKKEYEQWIDALPERVTGQCAERTLAMQAQFPELIRVRGEYLCGIWGAREHWWLKTAEGEIVDPTSKQFPTLGYCEYLERDESLPEPTGMCPNCGGYCYNNGTCCSDKCHKEYAATGNKIHGVINGLYPSGQACPWSKLTDEDVVRIKEMRLAGMSHETIAAHFPVTRRQIGRILEGTRWKQYG